jgi:glycosyltransferase involved in cell wall biosynthesis
VDEGIRIVAFVGTRAEKVVGPLRMAGVSSELINADYRSKWSGILALWALCRVLPRSDVLIVDYPGIRGLLALIIAKFYRVPAALRLRGDVWLETRRNTLLVGAARRFVADRAVHNAALVICVSRFLRNLVHSRLAIDKTRCLVVYAPLRSEFIELEHCALPKKRVKLPVRHLVSVTNFDFHGKVTALVRFMPIMRELIRSGMNCEWHVYGRGRYVGIFEAALAAHPELEGRVVLRGWTDNVLGCYAEVDAAVYFSNEDTLAQALLEAMSMGAPVIVNNYGPLRESVLDGRTGVVIDGGEDNVDVDSAKVRRLLDDESYSLELGVAARDLVVSRHSPIYIGEEFKRIFHRLHSSNQTK